MVLIYGALVHTMVHTMVYRRMWHWPDHWSIFVRLLKDVLSFCFSIYALFLSFQVILSSNSWKGFQQFSSINVYEVLEVMLKSRADTTTKAYVLEKLNWFRRYSKNSNKKWREIQKSKLNNSPTDWVFEKIFSHLFLSRHVLSKLFICFAIPWNFNFAINLVTSFSRQKQLKAKKCAKKRDARAKLFY